MFGFNLTGTCKKDRLFYYTISFQIISFLSIGVAFCKLETVQSGSSAYQETAGLNILAEENWKNYYN